MTTRRPPVARYLIWHATQLAIAFIAITYLPVTAAILAVASWAAGTVIAAVLRPIRPTRLRTSDAAARSSISLAIMALATAGLAHLDSVLNPIGYLTGEDNIGNPALTAVISALILATTAFWRYDAATVNRHLLEEATPGTKRGLPSVAWLIAGGTAALTYTVPVEVTVSVGIVALTVATGLATFGQEPTSTSPTKRPRLRTGLAAIIAASSWTAFTMGAAFYGFAVWAAKADALGSSTGPGTIWVIALVGALAAAGRPIKALQTADEA